MGAFDPRSIQYTQSYMNGQMIYVWQGYRDKKDPLPAELDLTKQVVLNVEYQYSPMNLPSGVAMSGMVLCEMTWRDLKSHEKPGDFAGVPVGPVVPANHDMMASPTSGSDMQVTYHKHSKRQVMKGCQHCGSDDLYYAHEVTGPSSVTQPTWCQRCKVSGTLVLVNADNLKPHECTPSPSGSGGEGEGQEGPTSDETDVDPWTGESPADAASPDPEAPGSEAQSQPEISGFIDDKQLEQVFAAVEAEMKAMGESAEASLDKGSDSDENGQSGEAKGDAGGSASFPQPCPDDDDPVLHSELNELDPVLRTQMPDMLRDYATMDHFMNMRRAVGSQVINLTKAMEELEKRTRVTVVINDKEKNIEWELDELTHRQLPDLITTVAAGEHCLMVAAAGCGKGKMARQAAKALGLRFLALPGSLSPQTQVSSIIGYMNSAGQYIPTLFRDAFENGGLIFLDELDNAHPACMAAVNDALALDVDEEIAFPDGMVKRHKDFWCVAAANTFGRGPDRTYAARQRGDAATWDRFSMLACDYDHALEDVLCRRTGIEENKGYEIIRYVRELRGNVVKHEMPLVIGMRASIGICRLVKAGMPLEKAILCRARRGASDADWAKVSQGVRAINFSNGPVMPGWKPKPTPAAQSFDQPPPWGWEGTDIHYPPTFVSDIQEGVKLKAVKALREANPLLPLSWAKQMADKVQHALETGASVTLNPDGSLTWRPQFENSPA